MFITIIHKTLSESTAFSFCHGAGLMQGQRMLWAAAHSARIEDWLPFLFPTQCQPQAARTNLFSDLCRPLQSVTQGFITMDQSDTAARKFIHQFWCYLTTTWITLTQFMGISFYANPSIPVELLTQPQPHLLVSNPMEKPMNLYFICPQSFPGSL